MSSPHLNSEGLWIIVCSKCQIDSDDVLHCDLCNKLVCAECTAENIEVISMTGVNLYKRVVCVACTQRNQCHLCDAFNEKSICCKECDLWSCYDCYIEQKEMCTQCAMLEQSGAITKTIDNRFFDMWYQIHKATRPFAVTKAPLKAKQ